MYDSPVRIKKVGTQTGHVWDTLRLTICKKCVIHNDWIFTTSEKHKPEQNGCFLFNVLPLRGNMGKISGIKILSQNETQVGRQHRNRVPNEWRERLFPYSILIAIRSIPQRCALTDPIGGHIVNYSLSQNWDVNPEDVLQRGTKSCPFSWLTIYVSHDRNFKLAKRKTLLPPLSIYFLYSCLQSVTKGDFWSYLA